MTQTLQQQKLKHIAIIMDGNRRWAAQHGQLPLQGHLNGAKNAINCLEACLDYGVSYVSLFAFSKENWARSPHEVNALWEIIALQLQDTRHFLHENNIKFIGVGDRDHWPVLSKEILLNLQEETEHYDRCTLIVALDYSGRWDIQQAIKKAEQANKLDSWESFLMTADFPDPDILIRTGFEKRLSNFYLYNLAYTELFFSNIYWPDFKKDDLRLVLEEFSKRKRRFGVGQVELAL